MIAVGVSLSGSVLAANIPPGIQAVPSITALEAIGIGSPQYTSIYVQSYYPGLGKGGGIFIWNPTSTASSDGCTVFLATGLSTGRWIRTDYGQQLDLFQCGAKGDNTTDDTAAIQNLENAAFTNSVIAFYPTGIFRLFSTITMAQGVRHQGIGTRVAGTAPISEINGISVSSSTYCYDLELPNGVANIEAPKFDNIYFNNCTNAIRYNNPANGFTDDSSSQEPFVHPDITNSLFTGQGTTGIAIQISKSSEGTFSNNAIVGGAYDTLLDLEGVDNEVVKHNTFGGGQTQQVLLNSHTTFGNDLVMNDVNQFTSVATGGVYITDGYRSSVIESNFFETAGTNPCLVNYTGGYQAVLRNNDLSISGVTNWLCFTDASNGTTGSGYTNIDVENNGADGSVSGGIVPIFNGSAGIAYFSGSAGSRRIIRHGGNFQANGDAGWPMNSVASSTDSIPLMPSTAALYDCNSDGLDNTALGLTVLCRNGAFQLTTSGSSNYLEFLNRNLPAPIGTYDEWVYATSASGATINGCVTSNASCISAYTNASLNASPQWIKIASAELVPSGTRGGANIYCSGTDCVVYKVALTLVGGL